ncbi:FhaA domain-containing protein [Brevibacterium ihuae]|uniref:FhaA domain-containing protein n=1 Tax=Brevibacterium ihuae TaxID=1631743 RepID=UPI000C763335|nr:DUF3662 and FHA domain-containing protein [Brevibacterium ihuae]
MGVLDRFEKGIERVVNGAFAKAFRSQVEPVELAGALRKEADTRAAVVSRGRTLTANSFIIELSQHDYERLEPIQAELRADLRQVVGDHAMDQGYSFVGPVIVTLEVAEDLDTGMYRVRASTKRPDGSPAAQPQNRGGYDPPSRANPVVPEAYAHTHSGPQRVAEAPAPVPRSEDPRHPAVEIDGRVRRLSQGTTVFGRSSSSADIVLDDPGVSRRHFEITVSGARAVATDLGSTNGTLLDGRRITSVTLTDGAALTAGDTAVVFRETETGGR